MKQKGTVWKGHMDQFKLNIKNNNTSCRCCGDVKPSSDLEDGKCKSCKE